MWVAMVESWWSPQINASVNTIISIAGSASEAIITSRLDPMPPKLVPHVEAGERQEEARAASSAMIAIRSADQENSKSAAEGRHQRERRPRCRRR